MNTFKGNHWDMALPPGWVGEHDDAGVLLFNPRGAGALQVRAHTRDRDITEQDLKDLAGQHGDAGARMEPAHAGDFSGFTLAYDVDNVFWRHWFVASGRHSLMLTYTCGVRDKEREIAQIRDMLASLTST